MRPLTLAEALDIVRRESPRMIAERARIGEAEAQVRTARVLPNPIFGYMGNYLTSGVNTGAQYFHQITVDQPLPLFGKRSSRIAVARKNVEATRLGTQVTLAELIANVRRTFYALLTSQERLALLERFDQDLLRVEGIVEGRQRSGYASQYDVLRIRVERRALLARIRAAQADVTAARGALAIALGQPGASYRADGVLTGEDMPTDFEAMWTQHGAKQPLVEASKAEVRTAEAGINAARHQAIPTLDVVGGLVVTQNANSTLAYLGLGLPLPIFDRGQGVIGEARARALRTKLEASAVERETRVALEQSLAVLRDRRAALADYERDVSAQVAELRKLTDAAYAGAQITILELLDALRTERELRMGQLDFMQASKEAEVEVRIAAGILD